MHRHQFVVSGSNSTPPPLPLCAQYIGRMYSSALASKRAIPSRASPSQVSVSTTGLSLKLTADWLIRAQWRSRSGATPSKARAPSKTVEPSHAACVRGPMIGTLPSCQSPSKKVQVCEKLTGFAISAMIAVRAGERGTAQWRHYCPNSLRIYLRYVPATAVDSRLIDHN